MAWGTCSTHGPIQDARPTVYGDTTLLYCGCGLLCTAFEPTGFVEHDELKALAATNTQPSEVVAIATPTPKAKSAKADK